MNKHNMEHKQKTILSESPKRMMSDICTLFKTKSGISSISFSSEQLYEEEEEDGDGKSEIRSDATFDSKFCEDKIGGSSNRGRSSSLSSSLDIKIQSISLNEDDERAKPISSQYDLRTESLDASIDVDKRMISRHVEQSNVSRSFNLSDCQTCDCTIETSRYVEGRLVARILPTAFADYDTQKLIARVDPDPFIHILSVEHNSINDGEKLSHPEVRDQRWVHPTPTDDNESVIAFDLYLFRSAFIDTLYKDHNMQSGFSVKEGREHVIHTLISHRELTRNNSFRKKESSSTAASSTGCCISSSSEYDSFLDNIFHLHMNRSSKEPASRTLRRLELSATRKLLELRRRSTINIEREENLSIKNGLTSSALILTSDSGITTNSEKERYFAEVDLTDLSSADMCRKFTMKPTATTTVEGSGSTVNQPTKWMVALTLPTTILPWKKDGENEACSTSLSRTASLQLSTSLDTILLEIISNPPTILTIKTFENFSAHVFTGVPLVILPTILFATNAIVTWFVDGVVVLNDFNRYTPSVNDIGKRISVLVTPKRPGHDGDGYQEAYSFIRLVEPLPKMPILELREKWIHDEMNEYVNNFVLKNGYIRQHRGLEKKKRPNRLRVLTYNILADLYAGREIDQQLMYSHCEPHHLLRRRRMPMIIAEILSYKADIICLQEVDAAIHNGLLLPVLEACGYQGFYSNKVTFQQEGCSMFWSISTFEMANNTDLMTFPLRTLLAQGKHQEKAVEERNNDTDLSRSYYDANSSMCDVGFETWESMMGIRHLLEEHEDVRKVYEDSVGQILQVARLSPKQDSIGKRNTTKPQKLIVANTHLFFHPMADHIRVLQAYAICRKLDEVRREPHKSAHPFLICGDFNSGPLSGAVRLLTHRSLAPSENDCWRHLNVYKWECGGLEYMQDHGYIGHTPDYLNNSLFSAEDFADARSSDETSLEGSSYCEVCSAVSTHGMNGTACPPTIVLPSCIPIMVSGCSSVPAFTNYAVDFVETLDYIFASLPSECEAFGFRPLGEAPMPSEDMVKKFVAMPNEVMPSDHVAVVCDFEWTSNCSNL